MTHAQASVATLLTRVWRRMTIAVGQGLAEYALLLGLIAFVAIVAFTTLGSNTIEGMFASASSI